MANDDPILKETVQTRAVAAKLAKTLGCKGAHKMDNGWHPCESHKALMALISGGAKGYRAYIARSEGKRLTTSLVGNKSGISRYVKQRTVTKSGVRSTVGKETAL